MKVLHINTYPTDGAACAAIRLHHGLCKCGLDSKMLFLLARPDEGNHFYGYLPFGIEDYPQPVEARNAARLGEEKARAQKAGRVECEILTFPTTSFDKVHEHPLVKEADIINLHWIARFIDYPSFFREIDKPVVWTLHDMNPVQGLFHYPGDIARNMWIAHYDEELTEMKVAAIQECPNLSVVTPSMWLKEKIKQSKAFHLRLITVIPNAVELDLYRPLHDKKMLRQYIGLPEDTMLFLFVATKLGVERKRFDLFCTVAERMKHDERVSFCCVGSTADILVPKNIISFGTVPNERFMPLIYNSADATCVLSDEDNLPNVILESMACGVPVIGVPHGGIQEHITDTTGVALRDDNGDTLITEIERFVDRKRKYSSEKIRLYAEEHFSQEKQATEYMNQYTKSVLKKKEVQL